MGKVDGKSRRLNKSIEGRQEIASFDSPPDSNPPFIFTRGIVTCNIAKRVAETAPDISAQRFIEAALAAETIKRDWQGLEKSELTELIKALLLSAIQTQNLPPEIAGMLAILALPSTDDGYPVTMQIKPMTKEQIKAAQVRREIAFVSSELIRLNFKRSARKRLIGEAAERCGVPWTYIRDKLPTNAYLKRNRNIVE